MGEIPVAPMDRILRNAGAERVSADAAMAFAEVLEGIAEDIAREAVKMSRHAGRKTVHASDVKIARR